MNRVALRALHGCQQRIDRFDDGGMSGGQVHLATWRDRLIPLLEARLQAVAEGAQVEPDLQD